MSDEQFKNASEYEPNDLALMTTNFQTFFLFLFDTANNNLPKDNGFTIRASIGSVSAEIVYTPVQTVSSVSVDPTPSKPAKAAKSVYVSVLDLVAEYPNLMTYKETDEFYWVGLGREKLNRETYSIVNDKLKSLGFSYVKWDKDIPRSKGWKLAK